MHVYEEDILMLVIYTEKAPTADYATGYSGK